MLTEHVGHVRGRTALAAVALLLLPACASRPQRVVLEPGVQVEEAVVDIEAGSVTVERDGVVVTAQGALLPAPRRDALHPTFWITVDNLRDDRISLSPADARLVDTFGEQHAPVPMTVGGYGHEVGYALVDPEIRTYVSLHFGWPYYPLYPYHGWFAHPRFSRIRYWHYDPFWTMGMGPVWIWEVRPRPTVHRDAVRPRDRREFVYHDARLTYVVVFPEIEHALRDMRLIVPGVTLAQAEGAGQTLEFELVFEQVHDASEERP